MGSLLGKISEETPKYRVLTGHAGPFQIREYSSNIVAEVTYDASGNNRGGGFMILANYIGALGNPRNVKAGAANEGQVAEAIAMTAPVLMLKEKKEEGAPETIAMTAPVLTMKEKKEEEVVSETIAMTAPVLLTKDEKEEVAETIAMTAPVLVTKEEDDTHEKRTATQPSDADASSVDLVKEGQTEAEKKSSMMTMQFVLPSKYTSLGQVPRPIDPRVRIREVPPRKYGVVTFNGIANEKVEEKKVASLREALHVAGFKVTGPHILAQYNPPWTIPFLRTNEVMLPIE